MDSLHFGKSLAGVQSTFNMSDDAMANVLGFKAETYKKRKKIREGKFSEMQKLCDHFNLGYDAFIKMARLC